MKQLLPSCLQKATLLRRVENYILVLGFFAMAPLAIAADTTVAATATNPAPGTSGTTSSEIRELLPVKDVGLGSDGAFKDEGSYQVRIGELHAPGGEAYLLALRIPSLDTGKQFKTVHLRTQLLAIAKDANLGTLANADLYVVGIRDTAEVLPADYYQGPSDSKATLIQDNFLTPESKVRADGTTGPFAETSDKADAALAKHINDALAKGALPGQYVILRINYDIDPISDGNNAYMVLTSGATGEVEPPLFTYTVEAAPKK